MEKCSICKLELPIVFVDKEGNKYCKGCKATYICSGCNKPYEIIDGDCFVCRNCGFVSG